MERCYFRICEWWPRVDPPVRMAPQNGTKELIFSNIRVFCQRNVSNGVLTDMFQRINSPRKESYICFQSIVTCGDGKDFEEGSLTDGNLPCRRIGLRKQTGRINIQIYSLATEINDPWLFVVSVRREDRVRYQLEPDIALSARSAGPSHGRRASTG